MPIAVRELELTDFGVNLTFKTESEPTQVEQVAVTKVNDLDIPKLLRDSVLNSENPDGLLAGPNEWDASDAISEPYFIRDVRGEKLEITEPPRFIYRLRETFYFGYLSDLDDVMYLYDEQKDEEQVLLPAESLTFGYRERFARFDSPVAHPVEPSLSATAVAVPSDDQMPTLSTAVRRIG